VICLYDTGSLPEQVVADALRTHPFVSTSDGHEASPVYETDEWAEQPLLPEGDDTRRRGGPIARVTISEESELDDLRRVVAETARAAGLAPTVVEDVAVAVGELARDGLRHGDGEATVQVARGGAGWHCEVTDCDSDQTELGRAGLSIARLVGERVELGSEAGAHTVRLTFTGAADARQRILDAASELFYQHGIRATGINTIISHSGVAKATFFKHFPAKNDLVLAWLELPASRWFDGIRTELDGKPEPPASRLLAFFDLLGEWFERDDFRGSAFQNAAAETPEAAHPLRRATYEYALEIRRYLRSLASDAGLPNPARTAEELHLLAEGAIATAVATRSPEAARVARAAAEHILS
jgi:AcrR family transcriptional regulator